MSGKETPIKPERASPRSDSIWAALLIGPPLSAAVLTYLNQPAFHDTLAQRYISHPVEVVEVVVFCCALGALLFKLWGWFWERRTLRAGLLPAWNGTPQPVAGASKLLAHIARLPRSLRRSWAGQRCQSVLDYLCRRGSAAGLDDHVHVASDNDAAAVDSSYSFIRFMIWAIPILGFLGTVLGITEAIAGVSPEQLEKDLSSVTGGLATAFDTTGLALMLTMATMFLSFLVERLEQKTLQDVDAYVDEHLFHRFIRPENEGSPALMAMEHLVQKQAEVWAQSMGRMQDRLGEEEVRLQDRLTTALQAAIEHSLAAHHRQLTEMRQAAQEQMTETLRPISSLAGALRQQVIALKPMADAMQTLGDALAKLQENEGQLIRLQQMMQHNLAALAAAGSFEEAVQSISAAVHLLNARSGMTGVLRAAA